jgi:ribosomal protein S18 acetylase RimI-like enzyme
LPTWSISRSTGDDGAAMNKASRTAPGMNIVQMNRAELEKHFSDFLTLFAENTRGHVIDQVIGDEYILGKARELLPYLESAKAVLFGAFDQNKLIGFLWAYPRVFLEESRLYINAMIVAEQYRGQGIGKLLVLELEKYARREKIPAIDVQTASFKIDAIDFYRKLGFEHERVQMRKSISASGNNK